MTSKSFCFTINNWTEEDVKILDNVICNYIIYGKEVGENGTPHLQGYITLKSAVRLSGLKKIHSKAHWEVAKTRDAAINYCMKEGKFTIRDLSSQGNRTDLSGAIDCLKTGGIKKLVLEHPREFVKYSSGLEKLAMKYVKPRDPKEPPVITWLYGKTGTGKTRQVVEKEPDLWISGKNLQWWDGYENQEAVLFDDFRGDFCTFHELLRILDRYPYNVQVKGGTRVFNSKRIYITSCYKPNKVYDTREDIGQLLRRLTSVTEVKSYKAGNVTDVTEVVEVILDSTTIEKKICNENIIKNPLTEFNDEEDSEDLPDD